MTTSTVSTFGTSQMTDLIMANAFYSKFADSFKDGVNLSVSTMMKLFLLMCFNEAKPHVIPLITKIFKELPPFLRLYWTLLLSLKLKRNQFEKIVDQITDKKIYKHITLTADQMFINVFWQFLEKQNLTGKATYEKQVTKIDVKTSKQIFFTYSLSNISFVFNNIDFKISSKFDITINNITKVVEGFYLYEKNKTSLFDFLPDKLAMMFQNYYKTSTDIDTMVASATRREQTNSNYFTEYDFHDLLLAKNRTLDKEKLLSEILFLVAILIKISYTNSGNTFDVLKRIDWANKYENNKQFTGSVIVYKPNMSAPNDLYAEVEKWWKSYDNTAKETGNINTCFVLNLSADRDFDAAIASEELIKNIYSESSKKTDTIKIHSIHLKCQTKTLEKPNPAYAEWEEKRKLLEKENTSVMKEMGLLLIPPKTLTEKVTEKNIISKQLNSISKPMESLYLRKKDKSRLLSSLSHFRDKKEMLQEFGLQNKLNVMLYGIPGTGKSTTIQAIATYLKKDIYYLDLQNVKTNTDLQILLDYTNNNVPGGAIIVMEDIDAMTNIVHRRQIDNREATVTELISNEEEKLSLEYLLNVLQGTLTIDGSIFLMTTNHIEKLDPALIRPGRFDLLIELKNADHYQINCIYQKMIGREIPRQYLEKISEDKYTPAMIIYHLKNYLFENVSDEEILADFIK